jgi:protease-4
VAVVIEINSPGGGVTASDEMHQSILDFRENTSKPVVVSMGDTAASGGYYIATAADRIVANETTLTGSLGVIIPLNNFAEAAEKYGIRQVVIKSGKYKDMGSAFREMRPDEREIFQSIVNQEYAEFVDVISEGRGIPEERVREIADGRVYSGSQARDLGLVDSFGGLDEASATAGRLAGARADLDRDPASAPGPAGAAGPADHGGHRARSGTEALLPLLARSLTATKTHCNSPLL